MNDLAAAFLWSVGLLFGSAAIGVTIDALLPWNIGSSIAVLLLFAGLGFAQRWHISATVENSPGCSPVNLHVRKRGFVTKTIGHWWNPLHIGSKVSHHSLVGGRYTYDTNEIDLNLPVIAKMADTANFPPDTIEEAVVDVLEHEAIHSAIHTNAEPIYEQLEQTFRNRFREASRWRRRNCMGCRCRTTGVVTCGRRPRLRHYRHGDVAFGSFRGALSQRVIPDRRSTTAAVP